MGVQAGVQCSHKQVQHRPEGNRMLLQQRHHFRFVALTPCERVRVQYPQNHPHDVLPSSSKVGIPSVLDLLPLLTRLCLLDRKQAEGRDLIQPQGLLGQQRFNPATPFQASHQARERTWFDPLFCRLNGGLIPGRGCFWLSDQASQDVHVWLREALLNRMVLVHMFLPLMG